MAGVKQSGPGMLLSFCNKNCQWIPYENSQKYGGNVRTDALTLDSCKQFCLYENACNAIEWIPANLAGNQCYTFTGTDAPENPNAYGITHYVCTSTDSWSKTENKNVPGGLLQSNAKTLDDCKSTCIQNVRGCSAIDWVSGTKECYTFTNVASARIPQTAIGVDHYEYKPVYTRPPGPDVGKCAWQLAKNSQAYGGKLQIYKTFNECYDTCNLLTNCNAFDWNYEGSCWFFETSVLPSVSGQQNIDHYTWISLCSWTSYVGLFSYGGTGQINPQTLEQCQSWCLSQPTCMAIEWAQFNSASPKCFTFSTAAEPTVYGTNINHYIKNCAGSGCTWKPYMGKQTFGGALQPSVVGEAACKSFCASQLTCKAVEIDNTTSACYTFTNTDPPIYASKYVNHYVLQGCSPDNLCKWTPYYGYQAYGGAGLTAPTSLQECKSACEANFSSCKAIEWAPGNNGPRCFTFEKNDVPSRKDVAGVDHYICDPVVSNYVTNGATSSYIPACRNNTVMKNSNTIGGILHPEANTVEECRNVCLKIDNCKLGFDFNNVANFGSRCYVSKSNLLNNGNINGVDHYFCNNS
ncbi:hypothetical protein HELRODRAFT_194003 [Helobdella robusta]|uniref:Apple domain-containing protein n=1 Tax=Helobdella robusta TaxID=6412 RepID=T1FVK0_HELRO|nr:hypothetical protein HELRODRAFT_194003 [Helobdella robusta]ESN93643.1 hypothetical protein HELRODRAFT_194003 [Helobdella robusta]